MASSDRIDELKKKFDENPRRYFAPLANEFRKSGDLEQAILICQEFLPQQPGHMSGHIVYGQALYETGRIDEARRVFETALSLDPENLIALRHLGDIAGRQGDPTSARRWYERVLEADPRNDEIQTLLANLGGAPAGDSATSAPAYSAPEPSAEPAPRAFENEPPRPVAAPNDEPDLLDIDVSMPEHARPAPVSAEAASTEDALPSNDFEPTAMGGIESAPETADLMPATHGRAEGFESTEFAAPETPVRQTEGLESAFEVETGVHVGFFQSVPGLDRPQSTTEPPPEHSASSAFPELDEPIPEDRGEVVPPHGDPIVESAAAPTTTSHDDSLLDFDMPVVDGAGRMTSSASVAPSDATSRAVVASDATLPSIPAELPPEVIAAEAELIDEGATASQAATDTADTAPLDAGSAGDALSFIDVGEPAAAPVASNDTAPSDETSDELAVAEPAPAEHRLFVTETMAELYLKQGLRHEALSVYEQLSTAAPGDERLSARVATLRAELATLAKSSGPRVRDFFASFAARRPGERGAASAPPSDDDFGANYTDEFPTPPSSTPAVPAAVEKPAESAPSASSATTSGRTDGSIDALFGHHSTNATEDSAASALAQAFGTGTDATPLAGNPTRPATGELTLDSVFREGSRGARASQGFSFDQFFSQNVEGDKTSGGGHNSHELQGGEPAERSEDDIEQFNSWLQGLKQR
ncbi:MAG: tetratricopeptide repeat protein [Gemmatimonadaceae bacterium]